MRKNAKRWIAFLLAVIMVATTCMYQSDSFLWATGDDQAVEDAATGPVEETQVVNLSGDTATDAGTTDSVTAGATGEIEESLSVPAEEPVEEQTTEQPADTPDDVQSTEDVTVEEPESTEPVAAEEPESTEAVTEDVPESTETETVENTESTETEEVEETETPEEPKAEEKPAQTLTAVAEDGATVTVTAPEGALPAGATVTITVMDPASVQQTMEAAAAADGKELVSYKVYDITIRDAAGNEIQPNDRVSVTVQGLGIQTESVDVYHIEDGNASKVAEDANANNPQFMAESFSPYVFANVMDEGNSENVQTTVNVTVVKADGESEIRSISTGVVSDNLPVIDGYDFVDARYGNATVSEIFAVKSGESYSYYVSGASGSLTGIKVSNTEEIILNYKPHVENYSITYVVTVDGTTVENPADVIELIGVKDVDAGEEFEFSAKPVFGYDVERVSVQIGSVTKSLTVNETGLYVVPGSDVTSDVEVTVALKEVTRYNFVFENSSNTTLRYNGRDYSSSNGDRTLQYDVTEKVSFSLSPNGQHDQEKKELNKLIITREGETIAVTPPSEVGSVSTKEFSDRTKVTVTKTNKTNNYGTTYDVEITGVQGGNLHGNITISVNFKNAGNSEIWPQDLIGVDPIYVKNGSSEKVLDPTKHEFMGRNKNSESRVYFKIQDGYSKEKSDITVNVTTDGKNYPVELQMSDRTGYDYYFTIRADEEEEGKWEWHGWNRVWVVTKEDFEPKDIRISV